MQSNTKTLAQRLAEARANNSPAPKIEQPVANVAPEPAPVVTLPKEKPLSFADYVVENDWKLTPIKEGEKAPRGEKWNHIENAISDTERARYLVNAGLLHAFSSTASIDIDNIDLARSWLKDVGIDLDALFKDEHAVQIVSGDANRGKLIYALPSIDDDLNAHSKRWPTKKIMNEDKTITVLELRCGATTGNSAQDVLPPSTNPRTKKQYRWIGDWRNLPPLPPALRDLWQSMVAPKVERTAIELQATAEVEELQRLIANKDPDGSYDEWCRIGMILHHETGGSDDGLAVWNEWSMRGDKYVGIEDLESHWQSFGNAANPATAGSLRQEAKATLEDFGAPPDLDALAAAAAAYSIKEQEPRVDPKKLIRLSAFASREPVQYLVEDLIEVGQLFGFIGKRKGGKSYAALDLAFAVAQGRPWAHHAVLAPGLVVWIAAEGARSLKIRRSPQWSAHYGDANIYVWPYPLNMRKPETFTGLVEVCRDARLVVIDSLRRVTPGAKENSSDELAEVLAYAEDLTNATGAAVGFIAHAGKGKNDGDATTARGTSAIEDAFEAGFGVEKIEGKDGARTQFKVTPVFARDEDTGDDAAMWFELHEITPEGIAPGVIVNWDVVPAHKPPKEKAQDYLALTDEVIVQLGPRFSRKQVHELALKLANEQFDSFEADTLKRGVNRALDARLNGKQRTIKATATETRGKTTSATAFELLPIGDNPDKRAHVAQLLADAPVVTDPDSDLM